MQGGQRQAYRMPANRQGLSQGSLFEWHVIGHLDQIAFGHSEQFRKGTLTRLHTDYLSRTTKIGAATQTIIAMTTGNQRINHNPLPLA